MIPYAYSLWESRFSSQNFALSKFEKKKLQEKIPLRGGPKEKSKLNSF